MKKSMICIVCPIGCHLEVESSSDEFVVTGNQCKRGPVYAQKELTSPTRPITSTVKIENAIYNRLPIKTSGEVPKAKIMDVMKEINKLSFKAPIKCGDVLLKNVLNTGVDIIASRSL